MRVLILGGSGFIGSAVVAELIARGHSVTAVARDTGRPASRQPQARWIKADLAKRGELASWPPLLAGIDAAVNCAGALQDGARDDVTAVQETAMRALYAAAKGTAVRLVIQISARTDAAGRETQFITSKRTADQALKASGVPFVILRPAIVVGRNAYGGTALLRALAAVPLITPLVYPATPMQFVGLDEVARAVAAAIEDDIAPGSDLELAAAETITLAQAVAVHRAWLGLRPARTIALPDFVSTVTAKAADLLGWLGWRSPLRSTAMVVAAAGVTAGVDRTSSPSRSLEAILADAPAGVQDLWFARLYFMKPVVIGALALFWLLSGAIALLRFDASSVLLTSAGFTPATASAFTVLTSAADIALGLGVVFQRYAALSIKLMIGLSLAYLALATGLQPQLWADPLGPLVKVLPSIVLALTALAILNER